jgi:hypothetical protein
LDNDAHDRGLAHELAVVIAPEDDVEQPWLASIDLNARVAQPGDLDDRLVPNAQLRAAGQCEQVQIHGGDVLAQLARLESLQANLRRRGRTEAGPPAMALPST